MNKSYFMTQMIRSQIDRSMGFPSDKQISDFSQAYDKNEKHFKDNASDSEKKISELEQVVNRLVITVEMITENMIAMVEKKGKKSEVNTIREATELLREAIQMAELFGLVRTHDGSVITGAMESDAGVVLVSE